MAGILDGVVDDMELIEGMAAINHLRQDRGSYVVIHSQEDISELQPCCVEVSAGWTNNEPKEFRGESVNACLRSALAHRDRLKRKAV